MIGGDVDLFERPTYLAAIQPFIDQPVIKVITGMRRCGKSSLLQLVARELVQRGISPDAIIQLNFEDFAISDLTNAQALHQHILTRLPTHGRGYVLLDEIQEVEGWEKVVNSLQATQDVDLYLTGSNSRLLSSELATFIAGRYITIAASTLSFAEYSAEDDSSADTASLFDQYQRRGGFPGLIGSRLSDRQHYQAVKDIYESALLQDAIARRNLRNVDMVRRVAAFAIDNVGNPFSARSVAQFMKSQRRVLSVDTVLSYLDALCEAFVLTRVPRLDLRGKALLAVNEKYYAGDHSLIHATLGYDDTRLPGVLENIVAMELLRRGYDLSVGKLGEQEVDFVATSGADRLYVQVTTSLNASPATRERELAPLLSITDSYPKIILSLDQSAGGNTDGVRHCYLPDWLTGKAS